MGNSTTDDHEDQDAERKQQTDDPAHKDDGPPAPFAPDSDEDSALGDTDEHSDA